MSRVPIRLRLTIIYVVVIGVVLALIGAFLYFRTKSNLDDSIAQSLRSRQGALRAYAASPPTGASSSIPVGEGFAQLLTPRGRVIESRPAGVPARLSAAQARIAAKRLTVFELHERERYLAGPARVNGRPAIALAAASLRAREHALEGLGGALLIGGPLALLVAGALGYATASAALRPVESMRRRAATISRADSSAELPVPAADDEVRRLALTLNEMLDRLAGSAESERRFIANASHELRTPLAALQAELELASRPGMSDEAMRAAHDRVRQDATRLVALSEGLLEISAADGRERSSFAKVGVDGILDEAARATRHRAEELGRVVRREPTSLTVTGDERALGRAMANLVENALVHGDGEVVAGATREQEPARIAIWVRDGGHVPDDVRAIAFDRFARGPDTAERPGAGLGLALVKVIAEQHGGEAAIENLDGGGVRAVLRLPV